MVGAAGMDMGVSADDDAAGAAIGALIATGTRIGMAVTSLVEAGTPRLPLAEWLDRSGLDPESRMCGLVTCLDGARGKSRDRITEIVDRNRIAIAQDLIASGSGSAFWCMEGATGEARERVMEILAEEWGSLAERAKSSLRSGNREAITKVANAIYDSHSVQLIFFPEARKAHRQRQCDEVADAVRDAIGAALSKHDIDISDRESEPLYEELSEMVYAGVF
jgi:hypothetical protein